MFVVQRTSDPMFGGSRHLVVVGRFELIMHAADKTIAIGRPIRIDEIIIYKKSVFALHRGVHKSESRLIKSVRSDRIMRLGIIFFSLVFNDRLPHGLILY